MAVVALHDLLASGERLLHRAQALPQGIGAGALAVAGLFRSIGTAPLLISAGLGDSGTFAGGFRRLQGRVGVGKLGLHVGKAIAQRIGPGFRCLPAGIRPISTGGRKAAAGSALDYEDAIL